uniref:ATP synthase F0 subunit 4 n=1 Tax=Paralemanea sp. TaxID=2048601 RepID=A0A343UY04_9FLOR|nr:ATP synthase F0 subunit 4 [Paralemanea sp.]
MYKYMFNLFALLLVLLTFNNILLLNEETLILISFVAFSWLFNENVGLTIKTSLNKRCHGIKNSLETSFKEVSVSLDNSIKSKHKFWALFYNFQQLAKHYLRFIYATVGWFSDHKLKITRASFLKHLQFVSRAEKQVSRLLFLLLIEKLKDVTLLRNFYCLKIKIPYFLSLHAVNVRQCIHSIKFS